MYDEFDGMKLDKLRELQEERFKKVVRYSYENVDLYKRKFKEAGISPDDIRTLEDSHKIPFTTKNDLRGYYPYGVLGVDKAQVVRFHASSGTTGKPTVVGFTAKDLDTQATLMARSLYSTGVRREDILQNAYTYGLFTGGLMFHYGAEKLGASVIPVGTGNTQKQIQMIDDMRTTVLSCTPSYSLRICEVCEEMGIDPSEKFDLKIGTFGAEPWSDGMRGTIQERLGIKAYDFYGLSELGGPGVSVECENQHGMHIWTDHFYPETIDPDAGSVLDPGSVGELIFTTLTKEGMPLLRYRTRDISYLDYEECSCGRYHPRLMRITGRSDDMLIVGGINVFPSTIEEVITKFEALRGEYQIIIERDVLDKMTLKIEVSDNDADRNKLLANLNERMVSVLSIRPRIELVEFGVLPRSMGKSKRVIDKRTPGE